MKFEEFWNMISSDLTTPKEFTTQTRPFTAKYSGGRIMVTSSDSVWPIERSQLRQIWSKALMLQEKMRFIHASYAGENMRVSSYIISLIKHYVINEEKLE